MLAATMGGLCAETYILQHRKQVDDFSNEWLETVDEVRFSEFIEIANTS